MPRVPRLTAIIPALPLPRGHHHSQHSTGEELRSRRLSLAPLTKRSECTAHASSGGNPGLSYKPSWQVRPCCDHGRRTAAPHRSSCCTSRRTGDNSQAEAVAKSATTAALAALLAPAALAVLAVLGAGVASRVLRGSWGRPRCWRRHGGRYRWRRSLLGLHYPRSGLSALVVRGVPSVPAVDVQSSSRTAS